MHLDVTTNSRGLLPSNARFFLVAKICSWGLRKFYCINACDKIKPILNVKQAKKKDICCARFREYLKTIKREEGFVKRSSHFNWRKLQYLL